MPGIVEVDVVDHHTLGNFAEEVHKVYLGHKTRFGDADMRFVGHNQLDLDLLHLEQICRTKLMVLLIPIDMLEEG